METIGKLTTFYRLMNEEAVVIIPKVQRDYAYGRQESKVISILNDILDKMLDAVQKNTPEIFDFVYGGTYDDGISGKSKGMTPLDGQQRLTTIFLLSFYASIYQHGVSESEIEWLKKFRYETRQSASDFCEALLGEIRKSILDKYYDKEQKIIDGVRIRDLITDHYKYLPIYDSDPTICSMLNVLDVIEEKCKERGIIDLWTRLKENDNIQFYHLDLPKFGLTDDLYIKMNSRGKKLTPFEIFKSEFERHIKNIDSTLKEEISRKIDNEWMDIAWDYVYSDPEVADKDKIRKADDGYMNLFNNILRIEMFRRKLETKNNRQPTFDEILKSEKDVKVIEGILDILASINKDTKGIVGYWNSFFYFSKNITGVEVAEEENEDGHKDKIRLFGENLRKPVFYLAMDGSLSVPEIVWFYAVCQARKKGLSYDESFKCFRVIRNILTATTRVHRAIYESLANFLDEVESIIDSRGIENAVVKTFNQPAVAEEKEKASTYQVLYDDLLRYENHSILQASLRLFLDEYGQNVMPHLKHFEEIFNNNTEKSFDNIRKAIIDGTIEYMQYTAAMDNEFRQSGVRKLFFIHCYNDLSNFLIKNEDRKNQDGILKIIKKLRVQGDSITGCNHNPDKKSWQYYYVNYNGANINDTTYGIYAWDDFKNKPLEAIILNSSKHSENYIEWKMLNHILFKELEENTGKYKLDNHASKPLEMIKLGVELTITQDGWEVRTPNEKYVEDILANTKDYEVTHISSVSNNDVEQSEHVESNFSTILVVAPKDDRDYIVLGKEIVNSIEKKYKDLNTNVVPTKSIDALLQ